MSGKIRSELFGASADLPRITELDIEKIDQNPDQPRKYFDETSLRELANSIESKGLLQPILVRVGEGGSYIIVAGERRYRAHKLLNRQTIAAIITAGDSDEIALIENIQREDLRPIEEAEALQRLIDKHGYKHEEVARVVGKARNTVTALLSTLTLPEDIRAECRTSNLASKTFLIELASAPADTQREAWESLKAGHATTRAVRAKKAGTREPPTLFEKTLRAFKTCTTALAKAGDKLSQEEIDQVIQAKLELDNVLLRAQSGRIEEG